MTRKYTVRSKEEKPPRIMQLWKAFGVSFKDTLRKHFRCRESSDLRTTIDFFNWANAYA